MGFRVQALVLGFRALNGSWGTCRVQDLGRRLGFRAYRGKPPVKRLRGQAWRNLQKVRVQGVEGFWPESEIVRPRFGKCLNFKVVSRIGIKGKLPMVGTSTNHQQEKSKLFLRAC